MDIILYNILGTNPDAAAANPAAEGHLPSYLATYLPI